VNGLAKAPPQPKPGAAPCGPTPAALERKNDPSLQPAAFVFRKPLTVSAADDPLEHEANGVAKLLRVQRTAGNHAAQQLVTVAGRTTGAAAIHRKCACGGSGKDCEECEKRGALQRSAENNGAAPAQPPSVMRVLSSPGEPLSPAIRARFEPAFGRDFNQVRVHADTASARSAHDLNAAAYTVGNDIVFSRGRFAPETPAGSELLAHELTHVVQQGNVRREEPLGRADLEAVDAEERRDRARDVAEREPSLFERAAEGLAALRGGAIGMVRQFSPEFADFLERGPLNVLRDYITTALSETISGLVNTLGLSGVVADLTSWFAETRASIEDAIKGGAKSCARFPKLIASLYRFTMDLLHHPVVEAFREHMRQTHEAVAAVASFFVEAEFNRITKVIEAVRGFANRVSGWVHTIREVAPIVWTWIKRELGLGEGDSVVFDFIQNIATQAWVYIKDQLIPRMGHSLLELGRQLYAVSGLRVVTEAIRIGQKVIAAIRWVWDNRDKDNLLKLAMNHPEFGQTMLPEVIESAQQMVAWFNSGVESMKSIIATSVSESATAILEEVTSIPILGPAIAALIQAVRQIAADVTKWASEEVPKLVEDVRKAADEMWTSIKPIVNVAALLVLGLSTPALMPIILPTIIGAAIWHFLPDCYKEPILNYILDISIDALRSMPDLPLFGPLWSLFKPGIIAFLVYLRGPRETPAVGPAVEGPSGEQKIAAANQLAKIILWNGLEFVGGYIVGILKGVWESLSGPFQALFMIAEGVGSLLVWVDDLIARFLGVRTTTPAEAPTPEQQALQADQQGALALLQQMGGELRPPAETVRDNFFAALRDHFSGGTTSTFQALRAKLGAAWAEAQTEIATRGTDLGRRTMAALLDPKAMEAGAAAMYSIGEFIGWLTGTIVMEIFLFVVSSGGIQAAKGVLLALTKIAHIVNEVGDILFIPFKLIGRFGKFLWKLVGGVGKMVGNAASAVMRRVVDSLGEIASIVQRYADDFIAKFGRRAAGVGEEIGQEAIERAEAGAARATTDIAGAAERQIPPPRVEPAPTPRTPDTPEPVRGPRSEQDELLQQGASKRGAELSDRQIDAEMDLIRSNPAEIRPSRMEGYVEEITLPNGHTWRRGPEGQWCRFSGQPDLMVAPDLTRSFDIIIPDSRTVIPGNEAMLELARFEQELWEDMVREGLADLRGGRPVGRNPVSAMLSILMGAPGGDVEQMISIRLGGFQSGWESEVARGLGESTDVRLLRRNWEKLMERGVVPMLDFHSERAMLEFIRNNPERIGAIIERRGARGLAVKGVLLDFVSTRYMCSQCTRAVSFAISDAPASVRSQVNRSLRNARIAMEGPRPPWAVRVGARYPRVELPSLRTWRPGIQATSALEMPAMVNIGDIDVIAFDAAIEAGDARTAREALQRIQAKGIPFRGGQPQRVAASEIAGARMLQATTFCMR
jgi:hypothetical protein